MREDRGTWMGHILEHVVLEIQDIAGSKVTFGKTRSSGKPGCYHVVYEYEDAWVGEQAGFWPYDYYIIYSSRALSRC